jgi:hypothetical protein
MIAPLMVAGVGISMSFLGKAAGTNSTMRQLGGVLGIALGVAAFAGAGSYARRTTRAG